MPRFFFDIFDGIEIVSDEIGVELADAEVARVEATRTLSEIAAQVLPGDGLMRRFHIVVRDSDQTMLFEIHIDFSTVEASNDGLEKSDGTGN